MNRAGHQSHLELLRFLSLFSLWTPVSACSVAPGPSSLAVKPPSGPVPTSSAKGEKRLAAVVCVKQDLTRVDVHRKSEQKYMQ